MRKGKDLNKRLRELREINTLGERITKVSYKLDDSLSNGIAKLSMMMGRIHFILSKPLEFESHESIQDQIDRAVEIEDYERAAALKKLL